MRIYVTNLRSEVTDKDLRKLFETQGKVAIVEIVKTLTTNESTGLGYVEMESASDAISVRNNLNGKLLMGNPINIYDRRIISDRRELSERRESDIRRDLSERREGERRQRTGEEELVSMFDELNRRESEEQRMSDRRLEDERRVGERRTGDDRRLLGL